jgi:phasin family protein
MAKKPENSSFMDMFNNFGHQMKVPNVDIEAILEHHRKNLEALQKSASTTASGAASVLSKQREMIQDQMREIAAMAENFRATSAPQETLSKQAEFVRKSFETAVKNASETAQIVQKSGTESLDILKNRIRESMEEIRERYEKSK